MLDQSSQKRRFYRLDERLTVHYRVRGEQSAHATVTENVSIGGAGLKGESYVPMHSALDVDLNLGARVVHAVGIVTWVASMPHSDRTRFGVEFIESDPLDSEYLADFIKNRVNKRKEQP